MNKTLLIIIAVAVIVAGLAFYSGMKYAQSSLAPANTNTNGPRMGFSAGGGRTANGGGFVSGEIISKDASSITIKLRDGGSKIAFFSDTTEVRKFVNGSSSDLEIGKSVVVTGKTNSDGSLTAELIQLRSQAPNQ